MPLSHLALPTILLLLSVSPFASAKPVGPPRSVAAGADDLVIVDAPPVPVLPASSLRSGSGLEWVRVHLPGQSPCPDYSASGDGQTVEHVWCFEGAGGDSSWPAGSGTWDHYPAPGAPAWDGWQLTWDPAYADEGNSCSFTDDWLWSAKEVSVPSWANGFHIVLVSPSIPVTSWTGGLVEYDRYHLANGRGDLSNTVGRVWDTSVGWSAWNDFDGFLLIGTGKWVTRFDDFSDMLGSTVDSVQVAWELIDTSEPGSNSWNKHGGVKYFVDNVSFASYDAAVTQFVVRNVDIFVDTFSLVDPAHTPFLQNDEQADWTGIGGARAFAADESLSVGIHDTDGISAGEVLLRWTTDGGAVWYSKTMDLSIPDGVQGGVYRAIIGADDGGIEDMTAPADGRIWVAGTSVDWYVEVTDDDSNVCTYPADAPGETLDFRVHPFGHTSPAQDLQTYLLVEDHRFSALDVEGSSGFDPVGGMGTGNYAEPAFVKAAELVRTALDELGLVYDRYVVGGSGSTVELEPRGFADPAKGLGGLMDELGNPNYDCVLWVTTNGDLAPPLTAESRLNLAAFLDGGGHLVATGDGIATSLGAGGDGADPAFLATYLGAEMTSAADDATEVRRLDTRGVGILTGINFGLYADCPYLRALDRLTLAVPAAGSSNSVLMEYANGGAGDDGRPSVILNERIASGGRAAVTGFDPGALVSLNSRACFYGSVLGPAFGLTIPTAPVCPNTGTGMEPPARRAGYALTAAEPNPFRERTAVRLSVPRNVAARVVVYDVLGRQVRTLVAGRLPAGTHVRQWDGRTDSGERAAAGIYFVRMVAGEFRGSRKMVLLR